MNTADDLSLRRMNLIKIWHTMYKGARKHLMDGGYTQIHGIPELSGVSGACENVQTIFEVDFFGRKGLLTQSGQLPLELTTPHFGKVWAEIQSFRAEPDVDPRHLCEFNLLELELQGGLEDLLQAIEATVKAMVRTTIDECRQELLFFGQSPHFLEKQIARAFHRMTYTEVIDFLAKDFPDLKWGDDLKADHEAAVAAFWGPTFITHYPLPIKFFSMLQDPEDPAVVLSADLILPKAGESCGAAARETKYERLVSRLKESSMYKLLKELGIKDEDFDWYLNAHKTREVPPHAGCGIGVNRVVQWMLGLDDIRHATPFVVNRETLR